LKKNRIYRDHPIYKFLDWREFIWWRNAYRARARKSDLYFLSRQSDLRRFELRNIHGHSANVPFCREHGILSRHLQNYRAVRLPFYNSQGIPGNTKWILIFWHGRMDAAAARVASSWNPPETSKSVLSFIRCIHIKHCDRDFTLDILKEVVHLIKRHVVHSKKRLLWFLKKFFHKWKKFFHLTEISLNRNNLFSDKIHILILTL